MTTPDGSRSVVSVRLFGGPEVRVRGQARPLSPYQAALLTIVYAAPRGRIGRTDIAWLMWEADDTPPVRHRIRQLLHGIRRRVGRPLFDANEDMLGPAALEVESDVDELRRLIGSGRLREAGQTYARGLVSGLEVAPSDAFEDWLDGRRLTLARELRQRAAVVWDQALEAGDWPRAWDAAEGLYRVSAGDVGAIAKVIEARARVGKTASAEAAFAAHTEALATGATPDSTLVALIDRVRSLDVREPGSPDRPARVVPLVGRKEELAAACGIFEPVRAGEHRLLVVSGESGIGKTRLLEEIQKHAVIDGFTCLYSQPVELEQRIPLNPIVDALSAVDLRPHLRALGEPWRAVIGSFLPSTALDQPAAEIPPIQESSLSRRLLDAFWMLFDRVAGEGPLLLMVDDLQWADATTLSLLQFMHRRWEKGSLGVIVAVRPELLAHTDPVKKYLEQVDPDRVDRIDLTELAPTESRTLVKHLAGDALDENATRHLCDLAADHPFYLTELTKDYLSGRLQLPQSKLDTIPVPVSLRQIFETRIRGLSQGAVRIANLLAVRARPMRLIDVALLVDLTLDSCADRVEELQAAHFVHVEKDLVRISHELFRSTLYTRLSDARKVVLHRKIGLHLRDSGAEDIAGELAIHFARAGERELAVEYGGVAAAEAMESGAVAEAAQFYEVVVDNEEDARKKAEATGDLGGALLMGRRFSRALPTLRLARDRLLAVGQESAARRVEIRRIEGLTDEGLQPVSGLLDRIISIKAESQQVGDWVAVAESLEAELQLRHRAGEAETIVPLFDEMTVVASRGSREASCVASLGLAIGVLFGRQNDALAAARHAMSLAEDELARYRFRAMSRLLFALLYRGEGSTPEAQSIIREALVLAQRCGDLSRRQGLETNIAVQYLDAGELDLAEEALGRLEKYRGCNSPLAFLLEAYNWAELHIARGEYHEAERHLLTCRGHLGPNTPGYMGDLVAAGLGLCALEAGRLAEAQDFSEGISPKPTHWYFDPSLIIIFRARLLRRSGSAEAAEALLREELCDLRRPLVLSWLKVAAELARVLLTRDTIEARRVAVEAAQVADELELRCWSERFRVLAAAH